MKKVLAILLAAMILTGLTACSGSGKDEAVGKWKAVTVFMDGHEMNSAPNITNEVRADGTFTYTFVGTVYEGTWTNENGTYTFTVDNEPVKATISGGKLSMSNDNTTIVFEKQ